jgi:L-lactate dehydrogenase
MLSASLCFCSHHRPHRHLRQHLASERVLSDMQREKLEGEVMDLQHAGSFLPARITAADKGNEETEDSDIIVITSGVRQLPGETRLSLVERNVEMLSGVVPNLVAKSPNAILIVVSNPVGEEKGVRVHACVHAGSVLCRWMDEDLLRQSTWGQIHRRLTTSLTDALTYAAWRLSGLPSSRVIGSGTYLDSSRFKTILAQRLGVSPLSIHGWIIGEERESRKVVCSVLLLNSLSSFIR